MKTAAVLSLESEVSLVQMARALRTARLARGESQQLAADRIGVGLSTYQRLENTRGVAAVAAGTLFTALSVYGLGVAKAPLVKVVMPRLATSHLPMRQRAAKKSTGLTTRSA